LPEIIYAPFWYEERGFVFLSFKKRLCGLILSDFQSSEIPLITKTPIFKHLNRHLKSVILKKGKIPPFQQTEQALRDYFSSQLTCFKLPLLLIGTPFQKMVWRALLDIPYGQTITYQSLAYKLNIPKATRAVAQACKSNPLPIIIPCHRVIGKKGLTGYSAGLAWKRFLLNIESLACL